MRCDCRQRAAARHRRMRIAKRQKKLGGNLFKGSRLNYLTSKKIYKYYQTNSKRSILMAAISNETIVDFFEKETDDDL